VGKLASTLVVLCLLVSVSARADHEKKLKRGLSKAAGEIIDRIVGCQHWLGEPAEGEGPEVAQRRAEIKKALEDLRCEGLDADRALYLKKQKNKKTRAKIEKAFEDAGHFD
jgi:hypothetical protein